MAGLDPGLVDSVSNTNLKVMVDLPLQNAISNQQNVNVIAQKALATSLAALDSNMPTGPQAAALQTVDTSGLAAQITNLAAAVSALQGLVKSGQTVPPVTATPVKTA